MPNYILGISAFYHDAAAALLKDGEIIAAAMIKQFRVNSEKVLTFSEFGVNY